MNDHFKNIVEPLGIPPHLAEHIWGICIYIYISYPENELIVTSGGKNTKAIIIESGSFKQYQLQDKAHFIINYWNAGQVFAYSADGFYLDNNSNYNTKSITSVTGYEFSSNDLFLLAQKHPEFYAILMRIVLNIYLKLEQKEIRQINLPAKERYVHFINQYPDIINHEPLQNIATFLNIHPGSLCRIRKQLNSE